MARTLDGLIFLAKDIVPALELRSNATTDATFQWSAATADNTTFHVQPKHS
jgi:hypothetical protein